MVSPNRLFFLAGSPILVGQKKNWVISWGLLLSNTPSAEISRGVITFQHPLGRDLWGGSLLPPPLGRGLEISAEGCWKVITPRSLCLGRCWKADILGFPTPPGQIFLGALLSNTPLGRAFCAGCYFPTPPRQSFLRGLLLSNTPSAEIPRGLLLSNTP